MSESTNKAEQRQSGYYWVKDFGQWKINYWDGEYEYWISNCVQLKSFDPFDEIDERPIQRHQPEILAECLEALDKLKWDMIGMGTVVNSSITLSDYDRAVAKIVNQITPKLESCISKLKSLI